MGTDKFEKLLQAKQELLVQLQREARQCAKLLGKADFSEGIYRAMMQVPREEFTLVEDQPSAYLNQPLAIGYKQTISQPFMVALMTDLLETQPHHRILEIGTGLGYQAAVLSLLVEQVYSIEIIPELASQAQQKLQNLGYDNVTVLCGDGYQGLAEHAPYDGIIITAATPEIPPTLLEQLKPGGKMVLPIGNMHELQNLNVVAKHLDGRITQKEIIPVLFVPFTRNP